MKNHNKPNEETKTAARSNEATNTCEGRIATDIDNKTTEEKKGPSSLVKQPPSVTTTHIDNNREIMEQISTQSEEFCQTFTIEDEAPQHKVGSTNGDVIYYNRNKKEDTHRNINGTSESPRNRTILEIFKEANYTRRTLMQ